MVVTRPLARAAAALLLAALVTVLGAGPAWAHGAGGADVSNFSSAVTGLASGVADDGTPGPDAPAIDGIEVRVVANDALLELRNDTDREVLVAGYQGEPYVRIGPDGVFENERSPAVYLNADRYGETPVPVAADPEAEPSWVRIGDGPVHSWHDHRIHWMAATDPPQVKTDPGVEHLLYAWAVPFSLGDESLAIAGELRWVPGPPAWPWVLAAAVLLSIPVGLAVARGADRAVLLRAAATTLWIVIALDLVHTVDDLLSVPASAAEIGIEAARVGLFLAVAAFGAWRGDRDDGTAVPAVVAGAVALFAGLGLPDLAVLSASQLAGTLPDAFARLVVAANLVIVLPVGIAAARAWTARPRTVADLDAEQASPALP